MKKKLLVFVATFAAGVIVGIVSQHILVHTPTMLAQTAPAPMPTPAQTPWPDTEEAMLGRMNGFQVRLDQLETVQPDSVEAISKQTEAQRGIVDLLIKYREAKQAKFTAYTGFGGNIATAIIAIIGTWLAARRKSRSTPPSLAAG